MKQATTVFSMLFFGATLMGFQGKSESETECENLETKDITFIEVDEDIDLGFDTAQYLPEGFDAYEGMGLNLDNVILVENEEEIDLGFDTAQYLPEGFNAYQGMMFDIDDIEYIEEEEEIMLDFDVQAYLPEDFKATSK